MGQEAGYMPVNLRTLYDAGVDVSYATDTTFNASAALAHELKSLNLVFSVPDLIKIMGPNSARFINKEKDLRTIEVRKLGDLVILVGNPFEGYWNLLTAVVVEETERSWLTNAASRTQASRSFTATLVHH